MTKIVWLGSLSLMALVMGAAPVACAGQAAAAPTRPVYSKNLSAPDIASDTRKLEAIVDNEEVTASAPAAAPVPAPAPQTILVMPSAQQEPVATPPAAVVQPVVTIPMHQVPALVTPSVQEPVVAQGWQRWTSDPTSVFTAIIALFTVILAAVGSYYVYGNITTARRQLRSYVFITNTEISGVVPQTQPVAQLAIRNTGQTPAHDVVVYGNMVFDEFPLQKDLPVLVFPDPQLTKENLGPGNERYKWEYALVPLTEDQVAKMAAGTHALYVYGEIRYHDVFKRKRYTKYLYYTGGTMGIRGTILGGYPEGNEAV